MFWKIIKNDDIDLLHPIRHNYPHVFWVWYKRLFKNRFDINKYKIAKNTINVDAVTRS